ncbi:MAG TPA: NUDIX hydrolase [Ktedonosporobacter sp.]|nr:NUDIX hydrolase [Ktedonosporobacter sp.]
MLKKTSFIATKALNMSKPSYESVSTIESVADALIVENGKVLLVQQKQQSAYGLWGFPGGHLEPGETPQEAVVREIQEELGAELVQAKLFKVARIQTTSGELELNTFTGALHGPVTLQDHELLAYGWFSLESLQLMQDKLRLPILLGHAQERLTSLPLAADR